MIHWLAGACSKSGVTVNGVAPALIQGTTMLPGGNEELAKSMYFFCPVIFSTGDGKGLNCELTVRIRNTDWAAWVSGRDRRNRDLDGEDGICDE